MAISTSSQSVAERVMRLVRHAEVIEEAWFRSGAERARHAETLDRMVGDWIAERPCDDVLAAFEKAEAAVAPIYDMRDVVADFQFQALGSIATVPDEELGPMKMQNVMFRLSETPRRIRWAGRRVGQDNDAVYGERLGLDAARLRQLRAKGVRVPKAESAAQIRQVDAP